MNEKTHNEKQLSNRMNEDGRKAEEILNQNLYYESKLRDAQTKILSSEEKNCILSNDFESKILYLKGLINSNLNQFNIEKTKLKEKNKILKEDRKNLMKKYNEYEELLKAREDKIDHLLNEIKNSKLNNEKEMQKMNNVIMLLKNENQLKQNELISKINDCVKDQQKIELEAQKKINLNSIDFSQKNTQKEKEYKDHIRKLEAQCREYDNLRKSLENEIGEIKKLLNDQEIEKREKVLKIEENLKEKYEHELKIQNQEWKLKFEEIEANARELSKQNFNEREKLKQLTDYINTLKIKNEELSNINTEFSNSKNDLISLKNNYEQLKEENIKKKKYIEELEKQLEEKSKEYKKIKNELNSGKEAIHELEHFKSEIELLKSRLEEETNRSVKLYTEVDQVNLRNKKLLKKIEALKSLNSEDSTHYSPALVYREGKNAKNFPQYRRNRNAFQENDNFIPSPIIYRHPKITYL